MGLRENWAKRQQKLTVAGRETDQKKVFVLAFLVFIF